MNGHAPLINTKQADEVGLVETPRWSVQYGKQFVIHAGFKSQA